MTSQLPAPFCPYKGLQPYEEKDQEYFFGRERDAEIIISNLYAAPLTVLYGASGVGKSSVLLAGVVPRLRNIPGVAAVVFREWQNKDFLRALKEETLRAVGEKCQGAEVEVDPDLPLDRFLRRCSRASRLKLFFILDQFEEYFLYHPAAANGDGDDDFDAQFARAVNRPEINANFILALRDDGLSKLDRFQGRIPNMMGNLLRLEHLDAQAAQSAICEPLRRYNHQYQPRPPASIEGDENYRPDGSGRPARLVARLLDDLKAGKVKLDATGQGRVSEQDEEAEARIETPFLQMVLTRLWDERNPDTNALELGTYERLGGAETIVRTHLDKVMSEKFDDDDGRDIAARLFHHLVTPSGNKIALNQDDLAFYIREEPPRVTPVVNLLSASDVRILRPVDVRPGQQSPQRYEIFHDVLAPAILDWRTRHEAAKEAAREAEKLRAEAERQAEEQRRLLAEAEAMAEEERRRAEEQLRLARIERKLAKKQKLLAESERARADEQQRRAEAEKKRAEEQARLVEVETQSRLEHLRAARRFRWATIFLAVLFILAAATAASAIYYGHKANLATSAAQQAKDEAEQQRHRAELAQNSEKEQRQRAEEQAVKAEEQRAAAAKNANDANEAKKKEADAKHRAEEQASLAAASASKAEAALKEAEAARTTANANEAEALRQREIADKEKEKSDALYQKTKYDTLYREATMQLRSGKKKEALQKFGQALDGYAKQDEKGKVNDPQAMSDTLLTIGGIYTDLDNRAEAEKYFQKALEGAVGDQRASMLVAIGDNYAEQSHYYSGGKQKALEYYKQAVALYASLSDSNTKEGKEKQAGVWMSIAEASSNAYDRAAPGPEARVAADQTLEAYERAARLYSGAVNRKKEAEALIGASGSAQRQNNQAGTQKALEYLNRALAVEHDTQDWQGEISVLQRIISINRSQGQATADLAMRVAGLYRAAGDKAGEARTLIDLSNSYIHPRSDADDSEQEAAVNPEARKGIELLRQAALLFNEASQKADLSTPERAEFKKQAGSALAEAAQTYTSLKEPDEASKAYQEALKEYEESDDRFGRIKVLTALSELAAGSGNKPEARGYLERSEQTLEQLPKAVDKFNALVAIGSGYLALQDQAAAENSFKNALAVARQAASSANSGGLSEFYYPDWVVQLLIGMTYSSHGFAEKAIEYLNRSLDLVPRGGEKYGVAYLMDSLGEAYRAKKDYKKAAEYYEQALQLYRESGYRSREAHVLFSLARLYREVKDVKRAEEYERRARDLNKPREAGGATGQLNP